MVVRADPAVSHDHVESFRILEDKMDKLSVGETPGATSKASPRVLGELAVENCQNFGATAVTQPQSTHGLPSSGPGKDAAHLVNPEPKFIKAQIDQQPLRHQRPALQPQTFEPLGAANEQGAKASNNMTHIAADKANEDGSKTDNLDSALAGSASDLTLKDQVQKHMAGQYEWLISYPAHTNKANIRGFPSMENDNASPNSGVVYGCNLVMHKSDPASASRPSDRHQTTNSFTFLATPLSSESLAAQDASNKPGPMSWQQQAPPSYEEASLKVPDVVDMVEHALSPALSGVSERSGSFVGSSRTGSFSLPRIEDSLEELDKLEDQLEAVGALAESRNTSASTRQNANVSNKGSPASRSTGTEKRASVANMAATTRGTTPNRPPARRSSTALSQRSQQQKPENAPSSASKATSGRLSATSRSPTSKSAKPPTVPKFELPGEAVARRLKEQREARLAQQQEAEKASMVPPKPRTITRPDFELPGEAISRRKREQQEAKLRAEEEEQRRKREFKARPIRNSVGPGMVPRETIASRARHTKSQEDEAKAKAAELLRSKRTSICMGRRQSTTPIAPAAATAQTPTRCSQHLEASAKGPVSAQKTLKRQSTVGLSTAPPKSAGKQGPDAVKSARQEAAERSRITSREWAEKKRREEQEKKEAAKCQADGHVTQA